MSISATLVAIAISAGPSSMITVRGHAVCEQLQAGRAAPEQQCVFETADGKRYPLIRVVTSRALFEDERLRALDLEVTGQLDAAGRLEVIQTRSIRNGILHDVYYWCETCHIRSVYGGDCWCCFQPFEFKEVPLRD